MSKSRSRSNPPAKGKIEVVEWDGLPPEGITQLEEFESMLAAELSQANLLRSPVLVITNFIEGVVHYLFQSVHNLVSHSVSRKMLVTVGTVAFAWYFLCGLHASFRTVSLDAIQSARFVGEWFILGVLSSIGFGTGLHSGILYAFPYIAHTTLVADYCRCLPSHGLFERAVPALWEPSAHCPCDPPADPNVTVSFFQIFLSVAPALFIWGIGTACGEIPPFFAAQFAARSDAAVQPPELQEVRAAIYAARRQHVKAGHGPASDTMATARTASRATAAAITASSSDTDASTDSHDDGKVTVAVVSRGRANSGGRKGKLRRNSAEQEAEEAHFDSHMASLAFSPVALFERMKVWMVHMISDHGAVAVVLLGAWPNVAFDMVGMACGYLGMPLASFLLATIFAKGFVKVSAQIMFIIAVFLGGTHSSSTIRIGARALDSVVPDFILVWLSPDDRGNAVEAAVLTAITEFKATVDPLRAATEVGYSADQPAKQSLLKDGGKLVATLLLVYFVKSFVEYIAVTRLRESQRERLHTVRSACWSRPSHLVPPLMPHPTHRSSSAACSAATGCSCQARRSPPRAAILSRIASSACAACRRLLWGRSHRTSV